VLIRAIKQQREFHTQEIEHAARVTLNDGNLTEL
jgi:hypothetical protein